MPLVLAFPLTPEVQLRLKVRRSTELCPIAGCKDDVHGAELLHRLDIEWKYRAAAIAEAISPKKLPDNYGIFHPRSTCVRIDPKKAEHLTNNMPNNANTSGN